MECLLTYIFNKNLKFSVDKAFIKINFLVKHNVKRHREKQRIIGSVKQMFGIKNYQVADLTVIIHANSITDLQRFN